MKFIITTILLFVSLISFSQDTPTNLFIDNDSVYSWSEYERGYKRVAEVIRDEVWYTLEDGTSFVMFVVFYCQESWQLKLLDTQGNTVGTLEETSDGLFQLFTSDEYTKYD